MRFKEEDAHFELKILCSEGRITGAFQPHRSLRSDDKKSARVPTLDCAAISNEDR